MKDKILTMDEFKLENAPLSLAQVLIKVKEELPQQLELASIFAKLNKAKYDAYIENGFTKEQALYLIK